MYEDKPPNEEEVIDEFLGDNAGLVVAEIELHAEDEAFERPAWLGAEVTHDPRYAKFADRTIHMFDGKIVEESVEAA